MQNRAEVTADKNENVGFGQNKEKTIENKDTDQQKFIQNESEVIENSLDALDRTATAYKPENIAI